MPPSTSTSASSASPHAPTGPTSLLVAPGSTSALSGGQVHLIAGDPPRPAGQHFAIRVDDVAAVVAELRAAGLPVTDPSPVGASLQAFVSDPAGNQVELHEVGGAAGAANRAGKASTSAGV